MKCWLGEELQVGDEVIYLDLKLNGHGHDFTKGTVLGFTPKMVRIEYECEYYRGHPATRKATVCPHRLIKRSAL